MSWTALPVAVVGDLMSERFWTPLARDVTILGQPPMCSVLCSNVASVVIIAQANQAIKFDTVKVDQDPTGQSIFDAANFQFVCRTPGWYKGRLEVAWPADTRGGTVQHGWEHNGVQRTQGNRGNPNRVQSWPVTIIRFLSEGDTLRPFAFWVGNSLPPGQSMILDNTSEIPSASVRMLSQ